ncbi:hypothetical protein Q5752_004375 [Cryptotrichosporon argae]
MPAAFFDIVGTCFSYSAGEEAIQAKLGPLLAKHGLSARVIFQLWLATHERDGAYMFTTKRPHIQGKGMSGWSITLPRILFQAGIPPDEIDAYLKNEDVEYILDEYLYNLHPRPGLAEMLETLEAGGIEFWACSGASTERVQTYFERAGIPLSPERIWDVQKTDLGLHKPHLEVYEYLLKERRAKNPDEVLIFGASHAWDVAGAKECGWQTAYSTDYEHYECVPMWGKHDVVAPNLAELGRKMVEKWGVKKA